MPLRTPALPDFPWDTIADDVQLAKSHSGGACDLSIGTPVDPTPLIAQQALAAAADSPGYPTVWGTTALRQAMIDYSQRRWSAPQMTQRNVLPVLGAKELVGWLPILVGAGPGHTVVIPDVAYPTYEVGALMAGARVVRAAGPEEVAAETPALVWLNSPSNPTGAVLTTDQTRAWINYARDKGALLAADECYGEFGWLAQPVSVLDTAVNDSSLAGLLCVNSLSKRSNLAGYRAGFVAGDETVVMGLLELRKHLGMMMPTPVQDAMAQLLGDQTHVDQQRARYAARRQVLSAGLEAAGFRIDRSEAGLYLWATREESGRDSSHWLATRGIIVAPGDFYGPGGVNHIRVSLTATDERINTAVARLSS